MRKSLLLLLSAVALLLAGCGDENTGERYNARASVIITSTVKAPVEGYQYIVTPNNTSNAELAELAKTAEKRIKQASGLSGLYAEGEEDNNDDDGEDDGEDDNAPAEPKDIIRNFRLEANSATAIITLTYLNSTLENGTSASSDNFGTWSGSIAVATTLYSRPGVKKAMVNYLCDHFINYPKDSASKETGIIY